MSPARYLLWLLIPPAAISIPLSFLFIGQVVRLSRVGAATVVRLLMAIYAVVALLYVRALLPRVRAVEKALGSGQDASRAMSDALVATERASLIGFSATGVVFVAAATFLLMPSLLGASSSVVAALRRGCSGFAWASPSRRHQ